MDNRRLIKASARILAVLALAFLAAGPVFAQPVSDTVDDTQIKTEIVIPSSPLEQGVSDAAIGTVHGLADYIGRIYNFAISVVGLVAATMMMIGGFQYLTAGGDAGRLSAAKSRIGNAVIGLVLALSSYALLKSLNPDLVSLKSLSLSEVSTKTIALPWCDELTAKGIQINPIWGKPGICGSVAEYMSDKTKLPCIYRSACPSYEGKEVPDFAKAFPNGGNFLSTCVQTLTTSAYTQPPFGADEVYFFADRQASYEKWKIENPGVKPPGGCGGKLEGGSFTEDECKMYNDWYKNTFTNRPAPYGAMEPRTPKVLEGTIETFARCMSCLEYGAVEKPRSANSESKVTPPSPGRCAYWQSQANAESDLAPGAWQAVQAKGQDRLGMCAWLPDTGGCAQVDITCKDSTTSCGDYNDQGALMQFDTVQGGYVWWIYGSDKYGTVSARPDVLQNLCSANPCGYNLEKKGCTGSSGAIDGIRTAATAVRDGIIGIQSCENK